MRAGQWRTAAAPSIQSIHHQGYVQPVNEGDADQLSARILAAIEQSKRRPSESDDEALRIDATEAAATRLRQVTARAPWAVTPDGYLSRIDQQFGAVAAQLETYVGSEEHAEQPWPTTWAEIQAMWDALLPLLIIAVPSGEAAEEAAEFRRRAGQLTRRLIEDVDRARAELGTLREGLNAIAAERDAAIAALKDQQQAAQVTITEQTNRLEHALRENQVEFTAAEERRESAVKAAITAAHDEFAAKLREDHSEFSEIIARADSQVTAAIGAAQESSADALARIEEIERKATKSYNAVGNAGFAGMYQRDANAERKQAWFWRIIAVITFVGLAAAGLHEVDRQGSWTVGEGLARLPVGVGLGSLAVFAISQVRRHHDAERASRKREIELTSIDPYLALIEDPAKVEAIKVAHARRVFIDSVEVAGQGSKRDDDPADDPGA